MSTEEICEYNLGIWFIIPIDAKYFFNYENPEVLQ